MSIAWTYFARENSSLRSDNGKWQFFADRWKLCQYIDSLVPAKTCLYLFAHNAFFDLQVMGFFWYFTDDGWTLDFYYDKGLTYILVIRKGNRSIKALSTTNWFATSLASLGETVGFPKLQVDFDTATAEELSTYCHRDVEIMVKAMTAYLDFIDLNDLGNFGMTKSAQSFNAFRHRFMTSFIRIHEHSETQELERNCYMGGRTEAFYIGSHPGTDFVSLDINAMYPAIMAANPMPTELLDYQTDVHLTDAESLLSSHCLLAKCKLSTDIPAYAKLFAGKILFPIGDFTAYLTTPGIAFALQHGHLVEIEQLAIYQSDYIFTDFVDFFYALRQRYREEGNKPYETMVKFIMNSLYGKFGQKQPIEEWLPFQDREGYFRHEIYDPYDHSVETETLLFNTLIRSYGEMNGNNSLVAIPAHITEYGRLMLYNIIGEIGYENVLYCDTDSVKIEGRHEHLIRHEIDESKIGALKIEERFHSFTIYGCKDYETENAVKLKGIPRNARLIAPGTYEFDSFCGQSTHLRKGEIDEFLLRRIVKKVARRYDKGSVNDDGRVVPFRFFDFQ